MQQHGDQTPLSKGLAGSGLRVPILKRTPPVISRPPQAGSPARGITDAGDHSAAEAGPRRAECEEIVLSSSSSAHSDARVGPRSDAEVRRAVRALLFKDEQALSPFAAEGGDGEWDGLTWTEDFSSLLYSAGSPRREQDPNRNTSRGKTYHDGEEEEEAEKDLSMGIVAKVTHRESLLHRCWDRWQGRRQAREDHRRRQERYAAAYYDNMMQIIFFRAWQWRFNSRVRSRSHETAAAGQRTAYLKRSVLRLWRMFVKHRRQTKQLIDSEHEKHQHRLALSYFTQWRRHTRNKQLTDSLYQRVTVQQHVGQRFHDWMNFLFDRKRERLTHQAMVELHSPAAWLERHGKQRGAGAGGLTDKEKIRLSYRLVFIEWLRFAYVRRGERLQRYALLTDTLVERTQQLARHRCWRTWLLYVTINKRQARARAQLQSRYLSYWVRYAAMMQQCRRRIKERNERELSAALRVWRARTRYRQQLHEEEARAQHFQSTVARANTMRFCLRQWIYAYEERQTLRTDGRNAVAMRESLLRHLTVKRIVEAVMTSSPTAPSSLLHTTTTKASKEKDDGQTPAPQRLPPIPLYKKAETKDAQTVVKLQPPSLSVPAKAVNTSTSATQTDLEGEVICGTPTPRNKGKSSRNRKRTTKRRSPSSTNSSSSSGSSDSSTSSSSSSSSSEATTPSYSASKRHNISVETTSPSTVTAATSRPSVVYYPVFLPSGSHAGGAPAIPAAATNPLAMLAPPPTNVYYGFDIPCHADPMNMLPAAAATVPAVRSVSTPASSPEAADISVSPTDSLEELQRKGRMLVASYRRLKATAAAEDEELVAVEEEIAIKERLLSGHGLPKEAEGLGSRLEYLKRRSLVLYERRLMRAQRRAQVQQLTSLLEENYGVRHTQSFASASTS